jgi:hypothetical protein
MTKQPLPLIDPGRTEFGYARSTCACADCAAGCRHLPGYLVPADLERLRDHLAPGEDLFAWARRSLLASPGALVARGEKVFSIPTLVPARRADGACLFLTEADRCAIHAAAPFGCAFFDVHQAAAEADARSAAGLRAVLADWLAGGPYAEVWRALDAAGLRAPPPEVGRALLRQARTGGS